MIAASNQSSEANTSPLALLVNTALSAQEALQAQQQLHLKFEQQLHLQWKQQQQQLHLKLQQEQILKFQHELHLKCQHQQLLMKLEHQTQPDLGRPTELPRIKELAARVKILADGKNAAALIWLQEYINSPSYLEELGIKPEQST